ncbi:ATP-binding protein [bacterium]|nr:ATP-binding protein [bacterium]
MNRLITPSIIKDLTRKMVFIAGPRQTGKTTLARSLDKSHDYLNYDSKAHRLQMIDEAWDKSLPLVVFDEIHKMKKWKNWLKGIVDTQEKKQKIVVTGSSKLDTYRKVGDSLAGRYFSYRLYPLDIKEISQILKPENLENEINKLLLVSGFPEPYLEGDIVYYKRWKKTHLDIILRQDLLDLENIRSITQIETLIELLRHRVGSPVSYSSLAGDLQVSDKTVKHWLTILESMFVIFSIKPYHKNLTRTLNKMPKYYFYDTAQIAGDDGIKFENLVALSLLKEIHYREDALGENYDLWYVKNKEGHEIDFLITHNQKIHTLIEAKWADTTPSPSFKSLGPFFKNKSLIQLVYKTTKAKDYPSGLSIQPATSWLAKMEF